MRIAPDHPRLRVVAVACLAVGGWLLLQPGLLASGALLSSALFVAAALVLAVGVSFWLLGTDRRAGVLFDSKGLSLNLGHSAAFVSWENIAAVGVSQRRASLLALGSRGQVGIRLHRPAEYLQSYEHRLPASRGLLAAALRLLHAVLAGGGPGPTPTSATLARARRRTGYDILIPEALLGGQAAAFVGLVETYRASPAQRNVLNLPGERSARATIRPGRPRKV